MRNIPRISTTLAGLCFVILVANSQSVTGTWTFDSGNFPITMVLLDNGTGEFQGVPVRYRIQNNKLIIDDGVKPVNYNYQVTQTTLVLSGGDLQAAVTFKRPGSSAESAAPAYQNIGQQATENRQQGNERLQSNDVSINRIQDSNTNSGTGLIGLWEGQQGKVIFYPDGTLLYNGTSYQYSSTGNAVNITGNDGSTTFNYTLANNQLTLSQNTNSAKYSRTSDLKPDRVDPQLVGKWCIMSTNYNSYSGGGSGSEECITLNANGTYEYFYSASRSAYAAGQSAYGGTASQNSDRGTWKTDGLTLVSVSQTTGKTSRYTLIKENAQNGDATIVIGGRKFVTAYNRPGW